MNNEDIKKQTINCYNQNKEIWRKHAKTHSEFEMKPLTDFQNVGIGKALVCVANGYTFEKEIKTLHKYQGQVDIMACDKTLGHLLDHGIKVDYVNVCDANVNYEKYMQPWEGQLQDTVLFMNVCANPKWAINGNWKDRYFFVNKDVMNYEREFSELSNCYNQIPAGTNVSNSMVVFATQCDNEVRQNFFGYDKILLIGYDYCFLPNRKYYAFDKEAGGKINYMKHSYGVSTQGDFICTSHNLVFSARWLEKYVKAFNLPIVQCSEHTILTLPKNAKLADQMQYKSDPKDSGIVKNILSLKAEYARKLKDLEKELRAIGEKHYYDYLKSV